MGYTIKKTYILASEKSWHDDLFKNLEKLVPANWIRIKTKSDFNINDLESINPDKIFIPHWSYIIQPQIYETWDCIVFHMTDLPYGRGGSPLQNLIVRGFKETKVSAIKVAKGIDTGDIYLKSDLSLEGTARVIFERSKNIIEKMIEKIILDDLKPIPQKGEIEIFKRRTPEESNIQNLTETNDVYDYIRMLDCEGYPNAFIETEHFKFEFDKAAIENDKTVTAHVRITKK